MHRWKFSALAAAAFVSAALSSTDAAALALGPISVQSALGEPLRAEIAIPQITPAEMQSLIATVASPDVFRAQGMDYSAAARSIAIELQRNTDGTAKLKLTSSASISDPFLDLVLQTNWNSGHLVRSYTLLLDPPASTRQAAAPIAAPQVTPAPAPTQAPPAVTGRTYSSNAAPAAAPATAVTTPRTRVSIPAASASGATQAPAAGNTSAPSNAAESVTIRSGQTAGQIANANRATGVSLDQMLVAMLRSNPDAFINGNVNRIRAGAVVQMPSREQALQTSTQEARRIVAAQSRDFNAYRRSLASKAPTAQVQAADRSSSGQVQAQVQETSPGAATPDKLTLSKGSVQNTAAAEQQLADQKQAQDQSDRLSELQRNLTELNQLAQSSPNASPAVDAAAPAAKAPATEAPATPATADASVVPSIKVSTAAATTADTTTSAAATSELASAEAAPAAAPEASATEPAAETPAPAAAPTPAPAAPPAPVVVPPSFIEQMKDTLMLPAAGAALALLLGLLGYRTWKKRSTQKTEDPALGDSELQPDSFFGGSGGQQVDTNNAEAATTMAYSPSQLDGGGDVDPVAEADVYLAYGRDVQAEEILKEALRSNPNRLAVHMKLAEIYAKRHDLKALENTARTMQTLSQGEGADWQRVITMGRNLDPNNAFYAEAAVAEPAKPNTSFADALNSAKPAAASTVAAATAGTVAGAAIAQQMPDLDLNLDLDLPGGLADSTPINTSSATQVNAPLPTPSDEAFAAIESASLDTKIDLSIPSPEEHPPTLVADTVIAEDLSPSSSLNAGTDGLDFDLSDFDLPQNAPAPEPSPAAANTSMQEEMPDLGAGLNFDLDGVSPGGIDPTPAPSINTPEPHIEPVSSPAPVQTSVTATAQPSAPEDLGLDFDLGSLDGSTPSDAEAAAPEQAGQNDAENALSTKLDLAQEFNAIGDSEGARALIEEVLAEASGSHKARAQKMLSELD